MASTYDTLPRIPMQIYGCDTVTGDEILRCIIRCADGTTTTQDYDLNGVPLVSNSSNFSASKDDVNVNIQDHHMFATNLDSGDANYGLSLELERRDTTTNGTTVTTYLLIEDVAGIGVRGDDVTALVTGGAPWSYPNDEEQLVIYPNVNFAITGAATLMPAIGVNNRVAIAGWMRAEINLGNDASGVRYTTDGSAPSDTNGQLAQDGGVIILSEDEILNAQFAPVGNDGLIDTALNETLSWEQRNRAPEVG